MLIESIKAKKIKNEKMALEKFCFCFKLQNGAFFLGVHDSIICFLFLIFGEYLRKQYPYVDEISFKICVLMQLIAAILMCIGIWKKNQYMLVPWLIIRTPLLVLLLPIACAMLLVVFPIYFPYYLYWCVCSTYKAVRKQQELELPYQNFNKFVGHHTILPPPPSYVSHEDYLINSPAADALHIHNHQRSLDGNIAEMYPPAFRGAFSLYN